MTLVGHWPLQEDSGDAHDHSGNGNTGTVNGATQGATGILGTTAYSFDGTDDDVTVSSNVPVDKIAVSAWVKTTDDNAASVARSDDGGDNPTEYALMIDWTVEDVAQFGIFDNSQSSWNRANGSTVVNDGSWHHIVGTWNGSSINIYTDATREDSTNYSNTSSLTDRPLYIGKYGGDLEYHDGIISDVRVYDHALTQSEVQYLYNVVYGEGRRVLDWK